MQGSLDSFPSSGPQPAILPNRATPAVVVAAAVASEAEHYPAHLLTVLLTPPHKHYHGVHAFLLHVPLPSLHCPLFQGGESTCACYLGRRRCRWSCHCRPVAKTSPPPAALPEGLLPDCTPHTHTPHTPHTHKGGGGVRHYKSNK